MDGETLDDRRTTRGAARAQPGVAVVFSTREPALVWKGLDGGKLRLGRSAEPGLALDGRLSREHAEIAFDGSRWTVRDLDSRNGTFVDGVRVVGTRVFDAAPRLIRLAQTVLLPLADGWSVVAARPMRDGDRIVGPRLRAALGEIERAAASGNVLVTGESGSGKELASRTFHGAGPHASGPLVAVNCATIPAGVAERLLFGAKRGAYSGADRDVEGYIQSADGGVLFLDELGEIDLDVQAKLLRVLETKEVLPLGATQPRRVDVRFCFATHRDLRAAVAAGKFRADLYYRVGQPEVALPPLRERLEEIPWLVCDEVARVDPGVAVDAGLIEACMLRPWPGNVRELLGEVRRGVYALAATPSRTLRVEHLSARAGQTIGAAFAMESTPPVAASTSVSTLPPVAERRAPVTREQLDAALRESPNASAAARTLGVHRSHLYRLMKQFGMDQTEDDGADE